MDGESFLDDPPQQTQSMGKEMPSMMLAEISAIGGPLITEGGFENSMMSYFDSSPKASSSIKM